MVDLPHENILPTKISRFTVFLYTCMWPHMRKGTILCTWLFYAISQNVQKTITGDLVSWITILPTLWRSNNSHAHFRLPRRSAYLSPLGAVQSSHSLRTIEVWSCDVNCRYDNGNCSFTDTQTAVAPKRVIKQSYRLERTFLWLGWLEMVVLTSSGRGHRSVTLCINRVTCGIRRCLLNND